MRGESDAVPDDPALRALSLRQDHHPSSAGPQHVQHYPEGRILG